MILTVRYSTHYRVFLLISYFIFHNSYFKMAVSVEFDFKADIYQLRNNIGVLDFQCVVLIRVRREKKGGRVCGSSRKGGRLKILELSSTTPFKLNSSIIGSH